MEIINITGMEDLRVKYDEEITEIYNSDGEVIGLWTVDVPGVIKALQTVMENTNNG